ncbi:hypothetical protein [Streptomyces sp. NPDC058614]|uniref:hypothetical protein n=1 Tax=Streptomyces sp. NPDC058614 TaxID=3346557 RepID=UPI003656FFDB
MEAWEHVAMAEDKEPDEPEDAGQTEAVDLSRFYASALKPFHGYVWNQNTGIGRMLAESAAVRMRPVLPRIVVDSPLIRMTAFTENLRRQMADLTGFNDMVRKALEPLAATIRPPQWHSVFASFGDVINRLYPENLRDVRPDLDDLEELLVEEGIPSYVGARASDGARPAGCAGCGRPAPHHRPTLEGHRQ